MSGRAAGLLFYGARLTYPSGWGFQPHTHAFFHLFQITGGRCTFTAGGRPHTLAEGDCLLVPPNVVHGLLSVDKAPVSVCELMFTVEEGKLAESIGGAARVCRPEALARGLIDELAELSLTRTAEGQAYLAACLETLLCSLGLLLSGDGHDPVRLNAQFIDISGFSPLSAAVIRHIDNHYAEDLSLDKLARELSYNKSYICTTFKNDCGFTVNDYLNLVRITRAVEYLSYTTSDIAGICAQVGFRNVPHFNRTFKKMLGEPPGYFRRLARINLNCEALRDSLKDTPFQKDLRALASRIYTVQELGGELPPKDGG